MEKLVRWLSHTQIAMYLRCPRQYYFRYIMKLIVPPAGVLKQGGAFHSAAEFNYSQKIRSHKDAPVKDVLEYYDATFESEWSREEVKLEEGESKGAFKDEGVGLVKAFHQQIAPTVQPVEVEDKFDYTFTPKTEDGGDGDDQSVHLTGRIDLIDDHGLIRDNKTMNPRSIPNRDELATDLQLSIYSLARRMTTRKVETGLTLDTVIKYSQPETRILHTKRSREMLEMTRNTIGMVARGIKAEVFPRHNNGWHCSRKWCGYYQRCMGAASVFVDEGENLAPKLEESLKAGKANGRRDRGEGQEEEVGQKGGQKAAEAGKESRQKGGKKGYAAQSRNGSGGES